MYNAVMRGLLIRSPWVEMILDGRKTWEIRGRNTTIRGQIALIRAGSGRIVGTCELAAVVGPLSRDELVASRDRHGVPPEQLDEVIRRYKCVYAWVMESAGRLPTPVRYSHPSGAVIWVTLPDDCLGDVHRLNVERPDDRAGRLALEGSGSMDEDRGNTVRVPVAKDGTFFSPECRRKRGYQIGPKGSEQWVADYWRALEELKTMKPPKWRRPSAASGRSGIVTGVRCIEKSRDELLCLID